MGNRYTSMSRRRFFSNMAAATAGLAILPNLAMGGLGRRSPNDKLNIAAIGVGGMGAANVAHCSNENIVALCDVDWSYAANTFSKYPNARKFYDYREMFDKMGNEIDAVIIATPDHTHAIATAQAMKMGKHVYVQKPLTHSVYESRYLYNLSQEYNVATQMGNQGNSGEGIRQLSEWIWDDAIGEIKEVYVWTNRPIWPQGLERPTDTPPVPETLNWDLFIGPAKTRPYHPAYTPWNWRAWWDFGTGALGDMGCHIIDPVFMALKLGQPTSIEGSSSQVNTESAPIAGKVEYHFPDRGTYKKTKLPPLKMTWYDGGLLPTRPEELKDGEMMGDSGGGALFIGSKGKIITGTYARNPRLLPEELDKNYIRPAQTIRRIDEAMNGGHELDWIRACKESPEKRLETSSNFAYSAPLNEVVVMGNLAIRLQDLKRPLHWDGKNMQITNISDADEIRTVTSDKFNVIEGHPHFDTKYATTNAKQAAEEYIKHTYRNGWSL